jgi:hypothetical protein
MNTLNIEEQNLLQSELLPGESVTWSGKPNPHIIFHRSDWYVIPFSLLWGGFAIFWELGVSGHGALRESNPSWFMMLWGVPFVVIGQYFVWGRFFYAAWKKRSLLYAITIRRGTVQAKPPQARTISAYLEVIPSRETTIRLNGIGTLLYGQAPPMRASRRGNKIALMDGLYLSSAIPVFVDIDDAATTSSIVARVRDQTGRSSQ